MLIYVSGPYRAATPDGVAANIEAAAAVAAQLWELGHAVICPHTNTAHFEDRCSVTPQQYIAGDLNMVARCDAVVMLPNWGSSEGARIEYDYAKALGIPIYEDPELPMVHSVELGCPEQVRAFREVLGQMYRLHLQKNADYSPANVLLTGEVGLVTRLWDKMARLLNLVGFKIRVEQGEFGRAKAPANEAVEDTYLDLANYGVIGLLLRRGKWGR